MSSHDPTHEALKDLQKELARLKSYTDDIGKAKDASSKVLQTADQFAHGSQRFVSSLQTHMNGLVDGMRKEATDIGKTSADASKRLAVATERFEIEVGRSHQRLDEQGRVLFESLVNVMKEATAEFDRARTEVSTRLVGSADRFDTDIDRSHKLLDVLGKQLDATAVRVEQMTGEIRQMDIPGRFSSISKEVQSVEAKLLVSGEEIKKAQQLLEERHDELAKQNKTRFIVGFIIGVMTIGLLLFIAFK